MLTVIFLAIIPNDVLLDYMFVYVSWCVAVYACGLGGFGSVVFRLSSAAQGMGLCVYIFVSSLRLLTQSSCQC